MEPHCPETGQAESGGNGNFRDGKPGICGGYGRGRDTVFRHPQGYEGTEQLSATSGRRLLQRDQSTRNFADI
nr:hypothetical protein [Bacteroides nordii]